jgi:hypothetical protein
MHREQRTQSYEFESIKYWRLWALEKLLVLKFVYSFVVYTAFTFFNILT